MSGSIFSYFLAIALVSVLVGNKRVRRWARNNKHFKNIFEDVESTEQMGGASPARFNSEISYELQTVMPRWYAVACIFPFVGGGIWWLLGIGVGGANSMDSDLSPFVNVALDLAIALFFFSLAGWLFSKLYRTPTSFKIEPETIYIKRWKPLSSPVIYFSKVSNVKINWRDAPPFYGAGKIIDKISFILVDGQAIVVPLFTYSPRSMHNLVQFLNKSSLKNKITSL